MKVKHHLYRRYIYIMQFLHFEIHGFCMDILFYNFCTNYVEIHDVVSL
jgi:hypothetical protein